MQKRTRAPGGGRKAKPPGEKFRRRNITLPPMIDAAVELLQDGDEDYSATLARLMAAHPLIADAMRWIETARTQAHSTES
jgi:hypothetical protein